MGKINPKHRTRLKPRTRIIRGKEWGRTKHAGEPEFLPTAEQHGLVAELVAHGATHAEIARRILHADDVTPISLPTLRKCFAYELEHGKGLADIAVSAALFKRAVGQKGVYEVKTWKTKGKDGKEEEQKEVVCVQHPLPPDVSAIRWWEATRSGKKEGSTMQVTGPDGQPLEVTHRHVFVLPANGRELVDITPKAIAKAPVAIAKTDV